MHWHEFARRDDAAIAVAERWIAALQRRLGSSERAAVVASGGTTPAPVYRYLSGQRLAWERVSVLLSDERSVAVSHDDSNERMLRETLARSRAASVHIPTLAPGETRASCDAMRAALADAPLPFASVLLGMGTDGHFASLFADSKNLAEGLDESGECLCIETTTAASPHRRISMTLAALLLSDEIVLLISGAEKRNVLDEALGGDASLPVMHLLKQRRVPVCVYWAA